MTKIRQMVVTLLTAAVTSLGFAQEASPAPGATPGPIASSNVWFVYDTMLTNTITPKMLQENPGYTVQFPMSTSAWGTATGQDFAFLYWNAGVQDAAMEKFREEGYADGETAVWNDFSRNGFFEFSHNPEGSTLNPVWIVKGMDVYQILTNAFPTATVVPELNDAGDATNYVVTLSENIETTEPITLPDDIGPITLDLNGYKIEGADGESKDSTTEEGTDGQSALDFEHSTEHDLGTTKITVRSGIPADADTGAAFQPGLYVTLDLVSGLVVEEEYLETIAAFEAKYNTDAYKTTKMVFRVVPAGNYEMQAGAEKHGRVDLGKAYCVACFEMTQKQYETIMGAEAPTSGQVQPGDLYPLGGVSYADITGALVGKINAKLAEDTKYGAYKAALPTEAQWERAARAGSAGVSFYGEGSLSDYAVFRDNSGDNTAVVGSKAPNAWGLHDVYGNVREWCLDAWTEDGPQFGYDPVVPGEGVGVWVTRGGSYTAPETECNSNQRAQYDHAEPAYGVRLVLNQTSPAIPQGGTEENPGIYGGDGGNGAGPQKKGAPADDKTGEDVDPEAGLVRDGTSGSFVHDGADGFVLIDPPAFADTFTYDGNEKTGAVATAGCTLGGVVTATETGDYTCWATLDATNRWLIAGALSDAELTNDWQIVPANVVIRIDDKAMAYGDAVPALTATITGTNGVDGFTFENFATAATSTSDVGTYAITNYNPAGASATIGNYAVTFEEGVLSITNRPASEADLEALLESFTNATYTYDGEYHGIAVGSDNWAELGITNVVYNPTNEFAEAGSHDVTVTFLVDGNHAPIDPVTQMVTIEPYVSDGFTVVLEATTNTYSGAEQKPAIVKVLDDRGFEVSPDDYEVIWGGDYVNAGDRTITVNGKNNYEGTTGSFDYTIKPETVFIYPDADQAKVYGDDDPEIAYTWTNATDTAADFCVTGALRRIGGEDVGLKDYDPELIGLGVTNVNGSAFTNHVLKLADGAAQFEITKRPLTAEMIAIVPATSNYTATAQEPAVTVGFTNETTGASLQASDYTAAWDPSGDKIAAGTYWYVVTAEEGGNFSGVVSNSYTIAEERIVIQVPTTNVCYGADAITIAYAITNGALKGTDAFAGAVTRSDADNHNVGTYAYDTSEVRILRAGDDVTASYDIVWDLGAFNITNKQLTAEMFTLVPTNKVVYNALEQGPAGVTAVDPEGPIAESDYAFVPAKYLEIGHHEETITAKEGGNYAGSVTLDFEILPMPFDPSSAEVTVTNEPSYFVYDATDKKPGVEIKIKRPTDVTDTLVEGRDYTVTYPADCRNVGEKTADITFTGALYSGSTNITYTVLPATLTVVSSNQVVNYGAEWPTVNPAKGADFGIDGLKGEDTVETVLHTDDALFGTDREQFSPVGDYSVEVTNVTFNSQAFTNYVLQTQAGVLTVVPALPADITVESWASQTNTYNAAAQQALEKPVVKIGDTAVDPANIVLKIDPETGLGDDLAKTAGVYRVIAYGTGNLPAVALATNETGFVILPYEAEIEWNKVVFDYTGAAQQPEGTVTNLFEGDTCAVTVTVDPAAIEPGDYTGAVALDNPNYTLKDGDEEVPFSIVKSDLQQKLEEIFGLPQSTVTPERDEEGNVTNWVVTLNVDTNGVIEIPDNLGSFTLDMNNHTVKGTNGVDGTSTEAGTDAGAAFVFVKGTEPDHGVTQVAVEDRSVEKGGQVTGGNGGDGHPAGKGSPAFVYAEDANPEAGFTEDVEERVADGNDGTQLQVAQIALVEARSHYPWAAAIDATYAVSDTNGPAYNTYKVLVTVSNETAGVEKVVTLAGATLVDGTNYVKVAFDGLDAVFGNDYVGDLTVRAMLWTKKTQPAMLLMSVAEQLQGHEPIDAAADATVSVDARSVKPIKVGETAMFNISSNEWDTTEGGAASVTYTRNGAGDFTLDPVQDRVQKAWTPVEDGEYVFTLTPGGETATFAVAFPANVTNSFPKESFDVTWNPEQGRWDVTLKEDLTGPVMIADDIGKVTLDLAGHTVTGTNGVEGAGGDALVFTAMDPDEGLDADTQLTIKDTEPSAHPGRPGVLGGDGADGEEPGAGGAGVTTNGPVRAVSVIAGPGAEVRGGNGGDGMDGEGAAGGAGSTVPYTEASGTVENGADGVNRNAWAWCDVPAGFELPQTTDGVSAIGDRLYFWKRNDDGAAVFDFDLIRERGWVPTDKTIHFVAGEIPVENLVVPATLSDYAELTFIADPAGTTLKAAANRSVFAVTAANGEKRRFEDLAFVGADDEDVGAQNGGAISIEGGVLEVVDCSFANCRTTAAASEPATGSGRKSKYGGAIFATGLAGDSLITNATFTSCSVLDSIGYGGAVYATAAADGVKLAILDTTFEGNTAVNGGAVCTVRDYDVAELPIALELKGDTFRDNWARDEGGAVFAEGDVTVLDADAADATLFEGNFASRFGGAICIDGSADAPAVSPAAVTIGSNTVFSCNVVSNDNSIAARGGAIAMMQPVDGCTLDIIRATFTNNVAISERNAYGSVAQGGAIYSGHADDFTGLAYVTTNRITKTGFYDNAAAAVLDSSYGGALATFGGYTLVDNCVFSGDTSKVDDAGGWCYGGALDFEGGYPAAAGGAADVTATILNSTFRYSNIEAIGGAWATLGITNCVAVGNSTDVTDGPDLAFDTCVVTMAYSAYGKLSNGWTEYDSFDNPVAWHETPLDADDCNLADRTTEIYDGDSLELDPAFNGGFNPVAVLGLVQPGVTDFKEVGYGSLPLGWSMGAFECPAMVPVLTVDGDRRYDGTTDGLANQEDYVWTLTSTNGEPWTWPELGEITNQLVVTDWQFGEKNAGDYASTNDAPADIAFGIAANTDLSEAEQERINRLIEYILQVATGTIEKRPVQFESESASKVYDTLPLEKPEARDCSAETLAGDEPNGLIPGEKELVTFEGFPSRTEVGKEDNVFTVVWGSVDPNNYDVKANVYGELEITPRPASDLKVDPLPDFTYGGTNVCPQVYVTLTNELGDVITNLVEDVDFGTVYTNNVNAFDTPYVVIEPSSNFTGTVTNWFNILPRDVEFKSASAQKEYDGTPLTTNEVWWTKPSAEQPDKGILPDEAPFLDFDVTGSQTKAGSSDNTFTVIWNEPGIVSSNYNVTAICYGTLTVDPKGTGDVVIKIWPEEYEWTGDDVYPAHIEVWDTATDELIPESEYDCSFENNRETTDSAIVTVTLKPESSWTGSALTNYWITAYFVEYYQDGEQVGPTEKFGALSGSNAVAKVTVPEGYCLDWQNSETNGVVRRYDNECPYDYNGQLKLVVKYEKDTNGDDIPDKYQKVVLFKVVNGYWNDTSMLGYDIELWKTLYLADGETWSVDGTNTLDAADIPAVGLRPYGGYAANCGTWCPELSTKITKGSFPFYLYAYGQSSSASGSGGRGGRSKLITTTSPDLSPALTITTMAPGPSGKTLLGLKAAVHDKATGVALAEEPLYGTKVIVTTMDSLDGTGAKEENSAVTDGAGRVKVQVDTTVRQQFFSVRTAE